jgi:hypothetical protein
MEDFVVISVSDGITPASSYRTGGLVAHVRLLKRLAVVAAAGFLALGLGAATASSASAAEIIDDINPSGEISDSLQW